MIRPIINPLPAAVGPNQVLTTPKPMVTLSSRIAPTLPLIIQMQGPSGPELFLGVVGVGRGRGDGERWDPGIIVFCKVLRTALQDRHFQVK